MIKRILKIVVSLKKKKCKNLSSTGLFADERKAVERLDKQ